MEKNWDEIINNVFLNKTNSIILEIKKYSNLKQYDKNNKSIKIIIKKIYIEKLIISNIENIKFEYEKISNNQLNEIFVNNQKFNFIKQNNKKETKNLNEINEQKISFDQNNENKINKNILEKKSYSDLVIDENEIVKLTFYNEILFYTKNIEFDLSKLQYKRNLKKSLIFIIFIIPSIYFLVKYFKQKKYIQVKKNEINSLIDLKYKPLNKKTSKILSEYI